MDSRRRSLMKALSWRLIALSVTTAVGYFFTESVAFAASIGLTDSLIKIAAYYFHERAWNAVEVGRASEDDGLAEDPSQSSHRLAVARSSTSPR